MYSIDYLPSAVNPGLPCSPCNPCSRWCGCVIRCVYVNVNNLPAISVSDFDTSGEPGPQAEGVNHLETPLRQLHVTHRTSSCAQRGGHVQLCSKPRGARGIETFRGRGQLLSCPPTTGPNGLCIREHEKHHSDRTISKGGLSKPRSGQLKS